jgi:hypothetical protein
MRLFMEWISAGLHHQFQRRKVAQHRAEDATSEETKH